VRTTPAVRRIRADEAALLRSLRLRALVESPDAFGSTVERETAFDEDTWAERAAAGATAEDTATFVAEADGEAAGMLTVALDAERPEQAKLFGLWVDPAARGAGLGEALMLAAEGWAGERAARVVTLWVVESNVSAIRLYERLGYAATGERHPLRRDERLAVIEFAKPIRAHETPAPLAGEGIA
jgi:ribosomal protein S18 acetylase RimI-like enzyme